MIKPIMLLCCSLLVASTLYAQKLIPVDSSKVDTLRIDPSHAIGGNAADVFEEIDYIPLESTKESTFGKIDQLEVTDEHFIILDETTNCILFFKRDGKFHAKIDGGSSQLDYTNRFQAFHFNKWTKQLVVKRSGPGVYLYYDVNGKLLTEVPMKDEKLIYWHNYRFVGKEAILDVENYNNNRPDDSTKINYFVRYGKGLMEPISAKGLPYTTVGLKTNGDILSANTAGLLPHAGKDDTFLFVNAPEYLIYEVSPQVIKLRYRFIFPLQQSLPANYLYAKEFADNHIKYAQDHKKLIYAIGSYFELGQNLFFKTHTSDASNKDENLIYNLRSGNLISYERISPDESNHFLPLWAGLDFANNSFFTSDGCYVYSDFSSLDMFRTYEEHKDKNIKYPAHLQAYFTKGSKKDNPVILRLKPKQVL